MCAVEGYPRLFQNVVEGVTLDFFKICSKSYPSLFPNSSYAVILKFFNINPTHMNHIPFERGRLGGLNGGTSLQRAAVQVEIFKILNCSQRFPLPTPRTVFSYQPNIYHLKEIFKGYLMIYNSYGKLQYKRRNPAVSTGAARESYPRLFHFFHCGARSGHIRKNTNIPLERTNLGLLNGICYVWLAAVTAEKTRRGQQIRQERVTLDFFP